MRRMKKLLLLFVIISLTLMLAGCETYTSKYKAVGFIHSNEAQSAYMDFWTFDGRMVFKLKSPGEGDLTYSEKLESGHATVYYDFYGSKTELFSLNGGEAAASHGGYVEAGTVYVIVETDGECKNGEFRFSFGG